MPLSVHVCMCENMGRRFRVHPHIHGCFLTKGFSAFMVLFFLFFLKSPIPTGNVSKNIFVRMKRQSTLSSAVNSMPKKIL